MTTATIPVTAASIQLVALMLTGTDWYCRRMHYGYLVSYGSASVSLDDAEAVALFADGLESAEARQDFQDKLFGAIL